MELSKVIVIIYIMMVLATYFKLDNDGKLGLNDYNKEWLLVYSAYFPIYWCVKIVSKLFKRSK